MKRKMPGVLLAQILATLVVSLIGTQRKGA